MTLGSASARPTSSRFPSAHSLTVGGRLFLIDCGEGCQMQMARFKVPFSRLDNIFISHLHGDHCFGLLGMISSFGLLGRTAPMFVHAPRELEPMLTQELAFYCKELEFDVVFQGFDPGVTSVVYDDRSLTVTAFPLKHRVPCAGFLFREKASSDHLDRAAADFYGVPQWDYNRIKEGGDFTTQDGTVIPHERLTKPADPGRSYAYCCDTMYNPSMIPVIKGATMIYHDCTYAGEDADRAKKHFHSTATDAARTAVEAGAGKLMLGHFSARYTDETILLDEAQKTFPDTILAKENLTVSI